MSVRELINNHPKAATTVLAIMVLCCLALAVHNIRSSNATPGFAKSAYFTVDDGATYFIDSFLQPYPFDHDGKPAYRACVFKVENGTPFVAYLERYTDAGKAAVAPLLGSTDPAAQNRYAAIRDSELEAKKPGGKTWFKSGSGGYKAVTQVVVPGTTSNPEMVFP